mmetsp:Transcript_13756/g.27828  ORF Transcript_13756/g.27828 Transcript_13756/m.27828 type:complete len:348 (+) Transcript_13756:84-1127(+)
MCSFLVHFLKMREVLHDLVGDIGAKDLQAKVIIVLLGLYLQELLHACHAFLGISGAILVLNVQDFVVQLCQALLDVQPVRRAHRRLLLDFLLVEAQAHAPDLLHLLRRLGVHHSRLRRHLPRDGFVKHVAPHVQDLRPRTEVRERLPQRDRRVRRGLRSVAVVQLVAVEVQVAALELVPNPLGADQRPRGGRLHGAPARRHARVAAEDAAEELREELLGVRVGLVRAKVIQVVLDTPGLPAKLQVILLVSLVAPPLGVGDGRPVPHEPPVAPRPLVLLYLARARGRREQVPRRFVGLLGVGEVAVLQVLARAHLGILVQHGDQPLPARALVAEDEKRRADGGRLHRA